MCQWELIGTHGRDKGGLQTVFFSKPVGYRRNLSTDLSTLKAHRLAMKQFYKHSYSFVQIPKWATRAKYFGVVEWSHHHCDDALVCERSGFWLETTFFFLLDTETLRGRWKTTRSTSCSSAIHDATWRNASVQMAEHTAEDCTGWSAYKWLFKAMCAQKLCDIWYITWIRFQIRYKFCV